MTLRSTDDSTFLRYCQPKFSFVLDNWDLCRNPKWRQGRNYEELPAIDEMLTEIVNFIEWFKIIAKDVENEKKISILRKKFEALFVHNMSVGEDVGLKNFADTVVVGEICDKGDENFNPNENFSRQLTNEEEFLKIETKNMFEAWRLGTKYRCDFADGNDKIGEQFIVDHFLSDNDYLFYYPALTGSLVLNLHRILLSDCYGDWRAILCKSNPYEKCGGILRKSDVETTWKGEIYIYPSVYEVGNFYDTIFDYYNGSAQFLKHLFDKREITHHEFVRQTIKLSSWILFTFVSLHPFADGNGRTARMVCAYSMTALFPFPIGIYNIFAETNRDDYVNAIVDCCSTAKGHHFGFTFQNCKPDNIAAMVLESSWKACQTFRNEFQNPSTIAFCPASNSKDVLQYPADGINNKLSV